MDQVLVNQLTILNRYFLLVLDGQEEKTGSYVDSVIEINRGVCLYQCKLFSSRLKQDG